MNKSNYKVLGVMSGTSLDGIDLAECTFTNSTDGSWSFQLGCVKTIPYSGPWKQRLKEGVHFSEGRLRTLNKEYTQYLGEIIAAFIEENQISSLDGVCSHGHTILHQPEKGLTLQIGNLPQIATISKQQVVCDFRVADVALGGQGAPLVPIGDRLLFSNYDYCLNLGGFANASFEKNGRRTAYDICPVNIVLNSLAEQLGMPYDDEGRLARNGSVDKNLLQVLNEIEFYKQSPPKSLGLEWVQNHIFPLLKTYPMVVEDQIATFTEHIAYQLAAQFEQGCNVLVTGGGAYNSYLLERVLDYKKVKLVVPDDKLLEFKEAIIFGLLGVLRLREEVNCLASVTGAKRDHSSGVIFN